jgi:hypothetical protein
MAGVATLISAPKLLPPCSGNRLKTARVPAEMKARIATRLIEAT